MAQEVYRGPRGGEVYRGPRGGEAYRGPHGGGRAWAIWAVRLCVANMADIASATVFTEAFGTAPDGTGIVAIWRRRMLAAQPDWLHLDLRVVRCRSHSSLADDRGVPSP